MVVGPDYRGPYYDERYYENRLFVVNPEADSRIGKGLFPRKGPNDFGS